MTAVSVRPHILTASTRRHEMMDGLTLAEIAANVPDLPLGFFDGLGCIRINGHMIPEANWPRVRPKGGTPDRPVVVELYVMPAKGSQLLQIFASVALIGATWAASTFLGPLAGAVVGIVGSLLLNALFPPSKPKPPKDPINGGFSGNPYQPLEILPTVAGRLRAPPPPLAPAYTYLDGEDIYVVAVVGYSGDLQVSDIWVNGTDITENEGIIECFTQEASGGPIAFNSGTEPLSTVIEEKTGLQLTAHHVKTDATDTLYDQTTPAASIPKWHSFRMRGSGDEVRIRLIWPSGLANVGASSPSVQAMPMRLQFRRVGDANFTNGPEFWFQESNQKTEQVRQEIRILWQTPPAQTPNDLRFSTTNFAWGAVYWAAAGKGAGRTGNWEFEADPYFKSPKSSSPYTYLANHITRDDNGFTVYFDPSVFPRGEYEFRVKRGLALDRGDVDVEQYTSSGTPNFFDYVVSGGTAKVAVDQARKTSSVAVESFATWDYTYPLPAQTDVPMSLIALKAKNVQIASISAVFTSRAYLWNGADWLTYGTTQNPAAIFRFLRTSNIITDPLDPSVLDDAALGGWYSFCAANGLQCGAIIAGPLDQMLATVCTAGWGLPRESETAGVIWEHDRSAEAPLQVFTPLNSANFQMGKPFDLLPHAIYAEFQNEEKDYQKDTRVIYGDGYDATTATRFDTITYDMITNPDLIDLRAQLDWRQLYYRQAQANLEISAENLMSQRGDLVAVAHDIITGPYAYGLVDSVLTSGSNVIGLKLQAVIDLNQFKPPGDGPRALGVAVRYMDGTVIEAAINEITDGNAVTFVTPFAIPAAGLLVEDCLVTAGRLNREYRRMLVFDIKRAPDWKASLVLVDEAQQIHAGAVSPGGPLTLDFSIKQNSQYLGVI